MMQVTVKTLRLYEQKGLLQPNEVDEWTGYRYYSVAQMQRLSSIRTLQQMGFSLAEIKEIFDSDTSVPQLGQLEQKITDCKQQLHMLQGRLQLLLSLRDSRKEISKMEKFSIQTLPSIIVASHREVIKNWQALGPLCTDVIAPEMHRLGCRCPMPGYCFTVEHDKEYKPTDIDIEYCEQVEEMGTDSAIIQFKRLPEVPTALCMAHHGPYDRFYESFPLHRRAWLSYSRATSHGLRRWYLEPKRPRKVALHPPGASSERVISITRMKKELQQCDSFFLS